MHTHSREKLSSPTSSAVGNPYSETKSKKLPEREGIRTPNRRNLFAPQPQHPHPLVKSVKLAQDESQAVGTIRLRLLHPPPSTAGTYRYRNNENKRRLTGSP